MSHAYMRELAPTAYLVRVDLSQLAANLQRKYGGVLRSDREAAEWLTQSIRIRDEAKCTVVWEPSPFRSTDEPGVFYTVEEPTAHLEPDEILSVRPAHQLGRNYGTGLKVAEVAA